MKRILIIEDSAPLCWQIERLLRGKYIITVHGDAAQALAWLVNGNECDLIVSDLKTKSQHTIDLFKTLKENRLQNIPIIILASEGDIKCISADAKPYACLAKPFDSRDLLKIVEVAFEHKKEITALT